MTTTRRGSEDHALQDVEARLARKFPDVPAEVVASAVTEASDSLDGPIRSYVPLLVEHAARDKIKRFTQERVPTSA